MKSQLELWEEKSGSSALWAAAYWAAVVLAVLAICFLCTPRDANAATLVNPIIIGGQGNFNSLKVQGTDVSSGGSVVSVAITSANGFAGTITNPTTDANLTLTTTVTGLALGNGTALAAYAGSSCTNQFPRSVNASGVFTCASVGSSDLASSLTLVTPALGVATLTSVNGNTIPSGTAAIYGSLPATTGSIGGGVLTAGACASGTVAVTGSTTSMTVSVSPNTYPGDGSSFFGYVSANGTVTVKVCAIVALTPTASTYNVRVHQ